MMREKNKNKGITLIALVITVIVLIIIAGVSISMLVGDNGLLNKAKSASNQTQSAQTQETQKLTNTELKISEYVDGKKYMQIDTPQDLKALCDNVNAGNNLSRNYNCIRCGYRFK